jgi:hypothetical protein
MDDTLSRAGMAAWVVIQGPTAVGGMLPRRIGLAHTSWHEPPRTCAERKTRGDQKRKYGAKRLSHPGLRSKMDQW